MSVRQLIQSLPDIVRDSRLETEIFSAYTQHTVYLSGPSARTRHVRKEERWVRDRFLGQGAYGTVYLERCEQRDGATKLRAVKQIKKFSVAGKELEYMRELEAISKFSHKRYSHCFVRSDGWFENADSVFITMEYLEKGDLHKYLTKPLPEWEARAICSQVLEGLKFMHENGFVHRDLKPGNIMVVTTGPEWFVKIADFGISKRRQQDVTSLHTLQMGTLGFAAPETMGLRLGNESRSYTAAVDLWSLGACVYMMLMNDLPFSSIAELFQYVNGMLTFPTGGLQSRSITDEAQQFVIALMSPDPTERPSSEASHRHPWITTNIPIQLMEIKPGDTMLSTASAAWSSISEEAEQQTEKIAEANTEKQAEELAKDKTVVRPEEPRKASPAPVYRSPYVDNCDDEHEGANKLLLPPGSPYVLDDADAPSPPASEEFPPLTPPTPSPEPDDRSPTTPPKESLNLPHNASQELLTPNLATRPRSPYFVQIGEIFDIFNVKRGRSKSTTENENEFKSGHIEDLKSYPPHYRSSSVGETPQSPITVVPPTVKVEDFAEDPVRRKPNRRGKSKGRREVNKTTNSAGNEDDNEPDSNTQSIIRYTGVPRKEDPKVEIEPETYERGMIYAKGIRYISCDYCGSQHHIFLTSIRLAPCGHWICDYCLMERFALVMISPHYQLECCELSIVGLLNRILIDPRVNDFWHKSTSPKYDRLVLRNNRYPIYERPYYVDDFILYLFRMGVFRDPTIKAGISRITGLFDSSEPHRYAPPSRGTDAVRLNHEQPNPRLVSPRDRPDPRPSTARTRPDIPPSRSPVEAPAGQTSSRRNMAETWNLMRKEYRSPVPTKADTARRQHVARTMPSYYEDAIEPSDSDRPRQPYATDRRVRHYDEWSTEDESDADTPVLQYVEKHLTSHRHQELDMIAHHAGDPGRRTRDGMSYTDLCSWLYELPDEFLLDEDGIPTYVYYRHTK